ncbi:MAG: ParA family protein [Oscillospiraceae bacterium]|nr:ParA family protein [Oscillospiraceae bacterium]
MKYCIWNNKGGVGKSFLTFCLSTEYALQKPDEIVVVADLCPQANASEMLLGGNGDGQENQFKLHEAGRTIAGYIKDRYTKSRFGMMGSELSYFVKVFDYNNSVPENLFLLSGDFELDLTSALIRRVETEPIKEAAQRAMTMLKDILSAFEESYKGKKVTFFVDCNPSFAIYTELAMFASDRLIIPCTGDFASLRGVKNVVETLYNPNSGKDKESIFNMISFSEKAANLKLNLPIPYLGIINKARTLDKKATVAYGAHVQEIKAYFDSIKDIKDKNDRNVSREVLVEDIKDCNNISLVVNYNGIPISKLEQKKYKVYDKDSQINQSQIDPFLENINKVINHL